jgi:hypothetical protein
MSEPDRPLRCRLLGCSPSRDEQTPLDGQTYLDRWTCDRCGSETLRVRRVDHATEPAVETLATLDMEAA